MFFKTLVTVTLLQVHRVCSRWANTNRASHYLKARMISPVLQQQLQVLQAAPAQSSAVGGGRSCLGRMEGLLAPHKFHWLHSAEGRQVLQPWVSICASTESKQGLLTR